MASTSPPLVTVIPESTRRGTRLTPDRFASSPCHKSRVVEPSAESAPMPVITTRRLLITRFPKLRSHLKNRLCVPVARRMTSNLDRLTTGMLQVHSQHVEQRPRSPGSARSRPVERVQHESKTIAPHPKPARRLPQRPDPPPSTMLPLRIQRSNVRTPLQVRTMLVPPRHRVRGNTRD